MAIRIDDEKMTSDVTEHHARRTAEGWEVSWLPDRFLDRNSAISAMTIAEVYGRNPSPGDLVWLHVRGWKQELGLSDQDFPA